MVLCDANRAQRQDRIMIVRLRFLLSFMHGAFFGRLLARTTNGNDILGIQVLRRCNNKPIAQNDVTVFLGSFAGGGEILL
jgi:hypothetical protein